MRGWLGKAVYVLLGVAVLLVGAFFHPVDALAVPEKPVLLMDNSRAGNEHFLSETKEFWQILGDAYRMHFLGDSRDRAYRGPLEVSDLDDVQVYVVPWFWSASSGRGETTNFTLQEMDLLVRWVSAGGRMVVIAWPVGQGENANLTELLRKFGMEVNFSLWHGVNDDRGCKGLGHLDGRRYTLIPGQHLPVTRHAGQVLAEINGRPAVVRFKHGEGTVVYIGGMDWITTAWHGGRQALDGTPPGYAGDNMRFFTDLFTGLGEVQGRVGYQYHFWRTRLDAVREHLATNRTVSQIPSIRAAEGLSSGDLTFTLTPEEKTVLDQAEDLYRETESILTRAEAALQAGDLKAVAGEWESLRTTVNKADQALTPIRDRWLEVTERITAERMFHEASPGVGAALFFPIIVVVVIAVILAIRDRFCRGNHPGQPLITWWVVKTILAASLCLVILSVKIPTKVHTLLDLREVEFGFPFPFIVQNLERMSPPLPYGVSLGSPWENPTRINPLAFCGDVLLFSLAGVLLYIISGRLISWVGSKKPRRD